MTTSIPVNIGGRIERDVHREMMEYWLRNADDHQVHSFDQYIIELAVYGFNKLPGRDSSQNRTPTPKVKKDG